MLRNDLPDLTQTGPRDSDSFSRLGGGPSLPRPPLAFMSCPTSLSGAPSETESRAFFGPDVPAKYGESMERKEILCQTERTCIPYPSSSIKFFCFLQFFLIFLFYLEEEGGELSPNSAPFLHPVRPLRHQHGVSR